MDKIFIGLIFIFFNFSLSFSFMLTISVNFLPDWIGYILLYLGVKKFKNNSKHFKDIIPSTFILIALSTGISIINLFMRNISELIFYSLEPVMTSMLIYILFKMINGIKDIEKKEDRNYGSSLLYNTWIILSIVVLIGSLINFISEINEKVLLVGTILTISVMIIFILVFNRTRMLYNSYR